LTPLTDGSDSRDAAVPERAFLVGLYSGTGDIEPERMLDELASLVTAAGASVAGRTYQTLRSRRDLRAATYIGRGKAEEVAELAKSHAADLIVFDNELSAAQIRELEKLIGKRVIDRSEVILDIFALRARTREAKLQIELAQLQYTSPRLRGMWTHLERQANTGGAKALGTRGPGEQQIEIDRRIVGERVARLRRELSQMHERKQREVAARAERDYCIGLVGYTNAGKSTLMNALTGADAHAADELFATVDTRTRSWQVEPGLTAMLSDTVGFVRDLPHMLVASFRSTLEEALTADLLLHVIDASHPQAAEQIAAVNRVLDELGCDMDRVLCVLNKVDDVADPHDLVMLRPETGKAICISAERGDGLGDLSRAVAEHRRRDSVWVRINAPAGRGKLQALAHTHAHIRRSAYEDDRWIAELNIERDALARYFECEDDVAIEELSN
jgi:GTP-binding protein HflX